MTTRNAIDYRAAALHGLRPHGWWLRLPMVVIHALNHPSLSGLAAGARRAQRPRVQAALDQLVAEGRVQYQETRFGPVYRAGKE